MRKIAIFTKWARKHFKREALITGPWTRLWQRTALAMFALCAMLLLWLLASCAAIIQAAFNHGDAAAIQRATGSVFYPVYALVPVFCGLIFAEIMTMVAHAVETRASRNKK